MNERSTNNASGAASGESCPTSGSRCPSCGGGKVLLIGLVALAAAYLWVSHRSSAPAGPSAVTWIDDYDAAVVAGARKNQPILLAFKATWCTSCKAMDAEVFTQQAAAKALTDWVTVHVDVDQHADLARKYNITGVPTFVVLSPAGNEVERISGGLSLSDFATFLASASAKAATPSPTAG
ncbi:MAG: thioredoxin family protein [Planctomycetes bacterium]|nr:thioredoxin family protein [Planctomycetota bacterium]